ncbi:MAG TPA: hypothetical protein VH985_21555, partial [Candidatus Binatia bacterium]
MTEFQKDSWAINRVAITPLPLLHRFLIALATVSIVLVQCVNLILSLALLYPDILTARGWAAAYIVPHAGLLVASSIAPMVAAFLLIRLWANSSTRRAASHMIASLVTLYYAVSAALLAYRLETGLPFDFSILAFQFDVAYQTLAVLGEGQGLSFGVILALLAAHYYGVLRFHQHGPAISPLFWPKRHQRGGPFLTAGLGILLALQLWTDNGLGNLILDFRQPRSAAKLSYMTYFNDSIEQNKRQLVPNFTRSDMPNLFVVQLE